jgi:hypothetical protein
MPKARKDTKEGRKEGRIPKARIPRKGRGTHDKGQGTRDEGQGTRKRAG